MMENTDITQFIDYEHAVDESVRMALRIEQFDLMVKQRIENNITDISALFLFSQLIQAIDRPDLKSKIAKSLSAHLAKLKQLGNNQAIDSEVLNQFIRNIEINLQNLRATTTRHVEVLKRYPAIYNLIQNNSNICHTSEVSGLTYWLSLAPSLRAAHFKNWYNDIAQTVNSVHLFLQLLRQQTE